jgi:hypothetical protein
MEGRRKTDKIKRIVLMVLVVAFIGLVNASVVLVAGRG